MSNVLGKYSLLTKIGEGGLSHVYLGMSENQSFAVKCLKPERAQVPRIVASFIREIQIASKLNHPNILKILDHGKVDGVFFAVSELLLAGSLHEMVSDFRRDHGRPPLSLTLYFIKELCSALRYLHNTSIFRNSQSVLFHGDLSLENIMITREGLLRLTDFGSAGQESSTDPLERPFGRIHYLPADILEGRPLTTVTDLYSLGVIAFILFHGTVPFKAENKVDLIAKVRNATVPKFECSNLVRSRSDEISLRIFFNKALHRDPALRFQTVEAFEEALLHIRFREKPLENILDASSLFSPAFVGRLIAKDQNWTQAISEFNAGTRVPKVPSGPVESLAGQVGQRKHPRISTEHIGISADVVDLSDKARGACAVAELGRGGMLVEWKGLPQKEGGEYGIVLHLGKDHPPISGLGKLVYEVSRNASPFAGFQFTNISPENVKILDSFVRSQLESFDLCGQVPQESSDRFFVDLYFRNMDEFRKEFESNISQGGLYVESAKTFENDETIFIRIHLPNTFRQILLKGRVVYSQPKSSSRVGVGVQLENDPKQLLSLKNVL